MPSNKDIASAFAQAFQNQTQPDPLTTTGLSSMMQFVNKQPVNQYDMSGISPDILSAMSYQQANQGIMDAAAKRVPDYETFAKAVLDRDIYSGAQSQYTNQLAALSKMYLDRYSKDPYFAFTKEGKELTKAMQNIATDPQLARYEEIKKLNEDFYETAKDKEVLNSPVVKSGQVLVQRDGQLKYVNPYKIRETDIPVTAKDVYSLVQTNPNMMPVDIEMSSYEDVIDKITSAASGLPDGKKTALAGSTKDAKNMRKQWLTDQGLSVEDWNTLTSEYIKRYGVPESKETIFNWVDNQIDNYLTSGLDEDLTGSGASGEDGGLSAKIGPVQKMLMGTKQAITEMSSPDLTQKDKVAIDERNKTVVTEMGEGLAQQVQKNAGGVQVDILQPVSKSLWKSTYTPIDNSVPYYQTGELPLHVNPIFQGIAENPNVIMTADGKRLDHPENVVPDASRDAFVVMENNKPVMYMPIMYYEDTFAWGEPDAVEESNFLGVRDENGTYRADALADVEDATGKARHYVNIMNLYRKSVGEDAVDSEYRWISTDDDIYEGVIRVPLTEDYEQQGAVIDKTKWNAPKAMNSAIDLTSASNNGPLKDKMIEY